MEKQRFTVTEDHIKLLRRAYVSWDGGEFGAPAIDCKRPYGNSSVYNDMAEILGITESGEDDFSEEQFAHMAQLHKETQTVLQIILATGEMRAGTYEANRYGHNWKWVFNG